MLEMEKRVNAQCVEIKASVVTQYDEIKALMAQHMQASQDMFAKAMDALKPTAEKRTIDDVVDPSDTATASATKLAKSQ